MNVDGHTAGLALPSPEAQAELLHAVYRSAGVESDRLAATRLHTGVTNVLASYN